MCGIAGIYRFSGNDSDSPTVERMLSLLARRGPDDQGIATLPNATLGNRRLAILDLSPAGHQPMKSADGRHVVTFNGEIYNYTDLRRDMGLDPFCLRSSSDTEVLLHAWARWGEGALDRLAGQWAFALYDTQTSHLVLARDRFGEKPLFYDLNAQRLAFASSLESLLVAAPGELDPTALAEYLTLRYVVSPRTVLKHALKLPPGHWMRVGPDGAGEPRPWFVPRYRPRTRASQSDIVEEFGTIFERACQRCLVSDVPTALLLSDGIDSNAIRAAVQTIPSFTFRLREREGGVPPEAVHASGGEVLDLEVSREERLEAMDEAFATFTEPVGDGAALATWMLIRRARDRATVFLCGHGGDEVLGGYRLSQDRFRLQALHALAGLPGFDRTYDRFLFGDEPLAERRRAFRDVPERQAPAAARYLIHRPLPADEVRLLLGRNLPEKYLGSVARLYAQCDPDESDLDRMQEVMLHTFLSENILSFADSVAMSSSAELRMPFLDRDLLSFVFSLPPRQRVGSLPGKANTKLVLRRWARGKLPNSILTRRKRSFQAGSVSDLLRHTRAQVRDRVLCSTAVRRAVPGVESWLSREPEFYRGPWEGTLWALLSLSIWSNAVGLA